MNIKDPFEPTLTDRYIWEAIRRVPRDQKRKAGNDIERTVHQRIDEAIDSGVDEKDAEYLVLKELGEPHLWARSYQNHPLQLIGPNYYLEWRHAIFTLIGTAALGLGASAAFINYFSGYSLLENVLGSLLLTAMASVHIVFWVTLLFHIIERNNKRLSHKWDPNNLPEAPSNALPSMYDIVLAVALLVLIVLLALWQHLRSPISTPGGKPIPIVNPEMWHLWLPLIFAWLVLNVIYVIWMYKHGRWTFRGAFLGSFFNLAMAAPAAWLMWSGEFFNLEFFAELGIEHLFKANAIGSFVIAAIVAAVFLWDTADSFIRADKRRVSRIKAEQGIY